MLVGGEASDCEATRFAAIEPSSEVEHAASAKKAIAHVKDRNLTPSTMLHH